MWARIETHQRQWGALYWESIQTSIIVLHCFVQWSTELQLACISSCFLFCKYEWPWFNPLFSQWLVLHKHRTVGEKGLMQFTKIGAILSQPIRCRGRCTSYVVFQSVVNLYVINRLKVKSVFIENHFLHCHSYVFTFKISAFSDLISTFPAITTSKLAKKKKKEKTWKHGCTLYYSAYTYNVLT